MGVFGEDAREDGRETGVWSEGCGGYWEAGGGAETERCRSWGGGEEGEEVAFRMGRSRGGVDVLLGKGLAEGWEKELLRLRLE